MDLSPRETADLAHFFARRFPRRDQVDTLARNARIVLDNTLVGDDGVLWSTVLAEARIQKRLRALARQASRQEPGDPNLQEVCRILAASEPAPVLRWLVGGGAVLALLAFGVGSWIGAQGPAPVPESPPPLVAAAPAEPAPVEPAPVEPAPVEPAPVEPAPVEPAPVRIPSTEAVVEARPPVAASTAAASSSRCPGKPGELIGYWYVGRSAPGAKGQTITIDAAANVRADYPDRHNGYDARAPLRCGLRMGDRVRLSQDPVAVPGGVYWVPLYGGDLLD